MIILGEASLTPGVTYRIYYGTNGFTDCVATIQIFSNVIGNLVRGVSYEFMATAINSNGESGPSNIISAEAPPLPNP